MRRAWITHDCDAQNDPKIVKLHRTTGSWEAYGVFWAIVERLRCEPSYSMLIEHIDDLCYQLRVDRSVVDALFDCELLTTRGSCFYSRSLISRASNIDKTSEKRAVAGKKGIEKRKGRPPGQHVGSTPVVKNAGGGAEETIVLENQKGKRKTVKKEKYSDDVIWLTQALYDSILITKPNLKTPNLISWADHMDKLIRIDKRDCEEVMSMIKTLPSIDFWPTVILSAAKFRKHYDSIELKVKKPRVANSNSDQAKKNRDLLDRMEMGVV